MSVSAARVAVERQQLLELDLLDQRLAGHVRGGRLLEQELLERGLVEAVGELAELGLDDRLLTDLDGVVHRDVLRCLRVVGHWIANPVK